MHTQHMPRIMIVNRLDANKEHFRHQSFDQSRPHSIRSLQFERKNRPLSFDQKNSTYSQPPLSINISALSLILPSISCLTHFSPQTNDALLLGNEMTKQKTSSKDVGLIINESLCWKELVEYRLSKALKCLFLLMRNTHQSLTITTKVHLYRVITNPLLLFGSGCWELEKVEHKLIENFNAKALKWTCGNMNYIDSLISTNLLPPL